MTAQPKILAENEEAGRRPVTGDPQSGTPVEEESRMSQNVALPAATEDDVNRSIELAAGLRALAEFVQRNPELYPYLRYSGLTSAINIPVQPLEQPREAIAAFVRAGLRAEHGITKRMSDQWAGANIDFGGEVSLHVYASRAEVCERIVLGTETVTETVPDPEALAAVPTVEVEKTVEKVEWRCTPLLAAGVTQ